MMKNNSLNVFFSRLEPLTIVIVLILIGKISCGCWVDHCKTCPTASTCTMCKKFYCLKHNGQCTQCSSRIDDCYTCSSCSRCTDCADHTLLRSDGQCQKCSQTMPRCLTCSSFTSCTSCKPGNYMVGPTCCKVPMPYCTGCVANAYACDNCISNSYCRQSASSCIPCWSPIPNCITCTSCSTCLTCVNNNYALTAASTCQLCSSLIVKCVKCSSPTVCVECLAPFYGLDSANKCQNCELINPNCRTCLSNTYCITCITTFYAINSTNMCQLCSSFIQHCIRCASSSVCMLCDPGYTVNPSFQCQPCTDTMDNCATCSSIDVCNSCMNGLFLVGMSSCCTVPMPFCKGCNINMTKCDECVSNSYTFATQTSCIQCYKLIPFCSTCSSNGTICFNCFLGYIFNGDGGCQNCGDYVTNCGICNNTPVCLSCISNQYALNNTQDCDPCIEHLPNCKTCSNTTVCTSCIDDTYAISSAGICLTCDTFLSSLCTTCYNDSACKTCQPNPDIFLTTYLRCKFCNDLIPYCQICGDQNHCLVCNDQYGLKTIGNIRLCQPCSWMMLGCIACQTDTQCTKCSVGHLAVGGCSKVNGCVRVDATISKSPCVACDTTEFFYDPVNDTCLCFFGHLAGSHCTDIVGCTTVQRIYGNQYCVVCDRMNKFVPRNGRCECQRYYQLASQTQACNQICGDGKRIYYECDDNNTMSGDGCSATCKIQYNYVCSDDIRGFSHCVYDDTISMSFFCLYKLKEPNTVEIAFSVRPYIKNLQISSTSGMTLSPSSMVTIQKAQFKDGKFTIKATYTQNIDGLKTQLKFVFDKVYIKSKSVALTFYMRECKGKPLDFERVPTSFNGIMEEVTRYLTIAALCSLLLGSIATKMIGVETINALQFIAISQTFAPKYYPTIEGLNGLTHVIGGFQNVISNSTIIDIPSDYQRLNYSSSFIGNSLLIIFIQLGSLSIYAMLILIESIQCLGFLKKKCSLDSKMKEAKQFIYRCLIFPSYIGFMSNLIIATVCLTFRIVDKSQNSSAQWQSALNLFSIFSFAFIFYSQFKFLFIANKMIQANALQKPDYVPIYLAYTFITNIMLECCILGFIDKKLYLMAAIPTLYLFVLMIYRPYKSVFHNVIIIFNQIGVLAAYSWLILQKFLIIQRDNEEYIGYGLASMASLIILLSTIRSIIQIKKKYFTVDENDQQRGSTTSKQRQVKRVNKRNEQLDDYLRQYYRKQSKSNIECLLKQNRLSNKLIGIEFQGAYKIESNRQILHSSKFNCNEISYQQKNNYKLKALKISQH